VKQPRLSDIAEICGVTSATVSLALSGKGSISREMVEKIEATAKSIGYSRREQRKDKGPSFKYVCILQWEDAPFLWHFSQPFVLQLEKILVDEGFRPIIIHKLPELTDIALYNEIKTAKAGAVFSVHYVNPELFEKLESDGVPVIVINNNNYQDRFWSVLTDDVQGSFEGTNRLIELGHTRIAYADYKRTYQGVVRDRFFGFKRALEGHSLQFPDRYHIYVDLRDTAGLERELKTLMESKKPPGAMFIHDDYFAAIVHKLLMRLGIRIPEDLSVICPGDVLDYSEPFFPQFSTMQIDRFLMIRMSWELLLGRLITPSGKVKVLKTKMHFIDRGSCIPSRGKAPDTHPESS
jgi:DNA-binding LacI/PurR family transcriptional regulator